MVMESKHECVKLGEFHISGNHVMLLAMIDSKLFHEQAIPMELVVKVLINGDIDDEIHFVLDWDRLTPLNTVDEGEQLHLVELENEDPLSPRARNVDFASFPFRFVGPKEPDLS